MFLFQSTTFFTARIRSLPKRRMGEGNIFSLSTLAGRGVPRPRSRWGGLPHLRSGWGYPVPGLGGGAGGYPISGLGKGVPHLRSGWGVPHPRSGWWGVTQGTPNQVWIVGGYLGYPLTRSGWWGVPPTH